MPPQGHKLGCLISRLLFFPLCITTERKHFELFANFEVINVLNGVLYNTTKNFKFPIFTKFIPDQLRDISIDHESVERT